MKLTADKLAAIEARHVTANEGIDAQDAHEDRAALLAEVRRLTALLDLTRTKLTDERQAHAAALAAVQAHAAQVEKECDATKRLADLRQVAREEADERADAAERERDAARETLADRATDAAVLPDVLRRNADLERQLRNLREKARAVRETAGPDEACVFVRYIDLDALAAAVEEEPAR